MKKYNKQRLLEMMNRVGGMPLINEESGFSDLPPGFSASDFIPLEDDVIKTPCPINYGEESSDINEDMKLLGINDVDEDVRDFGAKYRQHDPENVEKAGKERVHKQITKQKQGIDTIGRAHASTFRDTMDFDSKPIYDKKTGVEIKPKADVLLDSEGNPIKDVNNQTIKIGDYIGKRKYTVDIESLPDIDLEKIKQILRTKPSIDNMLTKNTKMKKSDILSVSMPALKSLLFNESDQNWYVITVCDFAGVCARWCYAQMGEYVINQPPIRFRMQMLNYLINDWEGWRDDITRAIQAAHVVAQRRGIDTIIRWHDTGDFMSDKYLAIAIDVAKKTPDVVHYAYTKAVSRVAGAGALPDNFEIKFSYGGAEDDLITDKMARAYVAPEEIFAHLQVDKVGDNKWKFNDVEWNEIKNNLVKKYNINPSYLLTHDEYMRKFPTRESTLNDSKKWMVIIKPGDTDIPASRKNTIAIINLLHK